MKWYRDSPKALKNANPIIPVCAGLLRGLSALSCADWGGTSRDCRVLVSSGMAESQKVKTLSAILLAICLLLTGCRGKSTFEGSRTSDQTGFRMEYSILDKEESAEMTLTEGDRIQVHISHIAGNVDMTVGQDGEEPIFKGTGQENADFILTIPKTGFYQISVTGHRAKGEVSFTCISAAEGGAANMDSVSP